MEEFGGAGCAEFGDGGSVGAVGTGVDVRQSGDDPVPPQQLEEAILADLAGCDAYLVPELGHVGDLYRQAPTVTYRANVATIMR